MDPVSQLLDPPAAAAGASLVGPHGEGLAIVTDQLAELGGTERILATLIARYPEASVFATRFDPAGDVPEAAFEEHLAQHRADLNGAAASTPEPRGVRFVGRPGRRHRHYLFPLYARQVRAVPLEGARVVLVLGSIGWSNGVRIPPGACHVAYVGGAPRPLYDHVPQYASEYPPPVRPLLRAAIPALRIRHRRLLEAPVRMAANSRCSADSMERILGRPVEVIYPPVRTAFFTPADRPRNHYLVVSRLRPHKRVDVVIDAFRELGHPLVVAGGGPWLDRLRRDAPPNVRFTGHVGDVALRELYRSSRALVSASVEEFGICLVEALAAGVPVVAPRAGGSGEIVADGVNGAAIDAVEPAAVIDAVRRLERDPVDPVACRRSAERFSAEPFTAAIDRLIEGRPGPSL
jgi:glycosyltransferase involved in cell wall biosynthesis